MKPAAATAGIATGTASGDLGRLLAQRERRFAAALLAPAFLALLATTTYPLIFLIWTSAFRMDLAMPFADGFVGVENYRALLTDDRFWSSLLVSLVYTGSTVVLQVALGLALALLVMEMKRGQGWFRVVAILPVVLSPAVVGMIWRTFMLAPEFGIVDYLAINAGLGSKNWLGDPVLAMISVIVIHTWQWTPLHSWCCWQASRRCRKTSTKPHGSTAPAPGNGFGASPCPCCGPRLSWC